MVEQKKTGKVKLISLTALVAALCYQKLHNHSRRKVDSEVDNSTVL